ncbi:MAG: hypothetical protein AABX70_06180 [Nanoarchaeota archaeon]
MDVAEREAAIRWLNRLRPVEQKRVCGTLQILNSHLFSFTADDLVETQPLAVLAAGSSLIADTYHDIDLFLLPQQPLQGHYECCDKPGANLESQLKRGSLPPYVHSAWYPSLGPPKLLRAPPIGLGVWVSFCLFHELTGFGARRMGRSQDLLDPQQVIGVQQGAEEII